MNIDTVKLIIKKPSSLFVMLGDRGLLNWIPDNIYIYIYSSLSLGYRVDLKNPRTFNEKLQWLKLYDRKPVYTRMVDKYAVREIIAEKIGEEHLIPLVGGPWNSVEEIDFDALPEQFVLKTTHDSGGVVICRDKGSFDIEAAKAKLTKHLKRKYYYGKREWPYKNVSPRIIAEQYMEDKAGTALMDFKFFCFNGEPKVMYMSRDRAENPTTDFFDMDFNHLDMRMHDPNSEQIPEKPANFEEMKKFAAILSKDIPHLRVDFYSINGKTYVGELTFYHNSGTTHIYPREWETIWGDWLELPQIPAESQG